MPDGYCSRCGHSEAEHDKVDRGDGFEDHVCGAQVVLDYRVRRCGCSVLIPIDVGRRNIDPEPLPIRPSPGHRRAIDAQLQRFGAVRDA